MRFEEIYETIKRAKVIRNGKVKMKFKSDKTGHGYKIQVSDQVGLQASYLYFNLPEVQKKWFKTFQPAYIEALRERTINPDLHLEDILMWTGRLVLSYIQYPAPNPSKKGIRTEVQNFFGNALTDSINKSFNHWSNFHDTW